MEAPGGPLEGLLAPPVPALNPASEEALRQVVWADFRLAVAFFVLTPLALLAAGVLSGLQSRGKDDEVLRIITGYWQASSLLLITVLLNIAALQLGSVTGLGAQVMIVLSLWYWEDLNEAVAAKGGGLAAAFRTWRIVATSLAVAGAVAQAPYLYCGAAPSLRGDAGCAAWLEAPLAFRDLAAPWLEPELCGQLGLAALALYGSYLAYLLAFILPSIGRRGLAPRPAFTWVAPLEWLGLASRRGDV